MNLECLEYSSIDKRCNCHFIFNWLNSKDYEGKFAVCKVFWKPFGSLQLSIFDLFSLHFCMRSICDETKYCRAHILLFIHVFDVILLFLHEVAQIEDSITNPKAFFPILWVTLLCIPMFQHFHLAPERNNVLYWIPHLVLDLGRRRVRFWAKGSLQLFFLVCHDQLE